MYNNNEMWIDGQNHVSNYALYAPINVKPVGGGRAWSGDLIVFVGAGVGHLTDLVLP